MRIKNEKEIINLKAIYLIFNLFYNLIINTNILKINSVIII